MNWAREGVPKTEEAGRPARPRQNRGSLNLPRAPMQAEPGGRDTLRTGGR